MDRLMGSKALAAEVRILLQEVGKLRDEKRALQYEVSELLAAKVPNNYHLDCSNLIFFVRPATVLMGTTIPTGMCKPLSTELGRH